MAAGHVRVRRVNPSDMAIRTAVKTSHPTERIRQLAEAVRLYRGELLPGYYQEVFVSEQRRMADLFWKTLHSLRQIARTHRISTTTVQRVLREHAPTSQEQVA